MTRRTAAAVSAAALLIGAPAHAHEPQGYYEYFKWRCTLNYLVCGLVPVDCGDVLCNEHGYEHDANTGAPIPEHQRGKSWDCKYPLLVNARDAQLAGQDPPAEAHDAKSRGYATTGRAVGTAFDTIPEDVQNLVVKLTSGPVDPDGPPPCPPNPPDVRQALASLLPGGGPVG